MITISTSYITLPLLLIRLLLLLIVLTAFWGAVDVTIVLNLLLFVAVLDWGLEGTALAINLIPSFLRFVGSCLIVLRYEECRRCWPGWCVSRSSKDGWNTLSWGCLRC